MISVIAIQWSACGDDPTGPSLQALTTCDVSEILGNSMEGRDLSNCANLKGASLAGADLTGAGLADAYLTSAFMGGRI